MGERLRELRKKKGLSLRQLHKEIGISHITLGSYERGASQPTINNCYKLCRYFGVPLEYLFLGKESLKNFHDVDLVVLFNKIDKLDKEDRVIIKNYLNKYLNAKNELNKIRKEGE